MTIYRFHCRNRDVVDQQLAARLERARDVAPIDFWERERMGPIDECDIEGSLAAQQRRKHIVRAASDERESRIVETDAPAVFPTNSCSLGSGLTAVWFAPAAANTTVDAPTPVSIVTSSGCTESRIALNVSGSDAQ